MTLLVLQGITDTQKCAPGIAPHHTLQVMMAMSTKPPLLFASAVNVVLH